MGAKFGVQFLAGFIPAATPRPYPLPGAARRIYLCESGALIPVAASRGPGPERCPRGARRSL